MISSLALMVAENVLLLELPLRVMLVEILHILSLIVKLTTDVKESRTGKGYAFTAPYFYFEANDGVQSIWEYLIMNDGIGLSLVTRETDWQWSAFVHWITIALVYAEHVDITQNNALQMPLVELLGPNFLRMFQYLIFSVGNYGEIFARTLGDPYNVTRVGRNQLNVDGGPQLVPMRFI